METTERDIPSRHTLESFKLRLALRPFLAIEKRLMDHLAGGRRHAKNLRVRELLERGLECEACACPVDAAADPDLRPDELNVDLTRPHDAGVLDALNAIPEKVRPYWLRERLLAGFAAFEQGSIASTTARASIAPDSEPVPHLSYAVGAPRLQLHPLPPPALANRGGTGDSAMPAATGGELDIDLSDGHQPRAPAMRVEHKAESDSAEPKLRPELRSLFAGMKGD